MQGLEEEEGALEQRDEVNKRKPWWGFS